MKRNIFFALLFFMSIILLLISCKSNTSQSAVIQPAEAPEKPEEIIPLRPLNENEFIYYAYNGKDTSHLNNRDIARMRSFKAPVDKTSYYLEITFNDAEKTAIIFRDDENIAENYIKTFEEYQAQLQNATQSIIESRNTQTKIPSFFTNKDIVRYTTGDLRIAFSEEDTKKFLGLITIFEQDYTNDDDGYDSPGNAFVSFYLDEEGLQQFISAIEKSKPVISE